MLSEQTYRTVVLEDSQTLWELHHGQLTEKPRLGAEHNDLMSTLALVLGQQLDRKKFRFRINSTHVRKSSDRYYIPDFFVVDSEYFQEQRNQSGRLEVYDAPLPLVVEIRSPSTGGYDVLDKLPEYQARGDLEIWLLHPYEKTLTAWRKQPDGSYSVEVFASGTVYAAFLPNVSVVVEALFDFD
jgi:Uma2 family endonuclease